MYDTWALELRIMVSLILSVVLGFIIGLERKIRFKEAGIRTHTIVSIGSCLMMLVSKYAFGDDADTARVAAQIVSGVGFLGAGMIVYRQHEVRGLTTAAGVWATAGVGMACGGGLYILATGATAILVAVQCLLHANIPLFHQKRFFSIKIEFIQRGNSNEKIKQIFGITRFKHLNLIRRDNEIYYSATIETDTEFSSSALNKILDENTCITSIERCENE